ncbi:MAG: sulfatase-like hydrolase/transferase [Deltaproteobacteria bacterium]|nr:sulfatase-like hydrolase/transferase [Deltaproteobacteria bacterium]
MMSKAIVYSIVGILVALSSCCPPTAPCPEGEKPKTEDKPQQPGHSFNDVIFISIDTQRVDRLGVYGYSHDTSPNIDKFAKEAVVFENHHAQAPLTLVSHVSMMTGLNPVSHGVRSNGTFKLTDAADTLAERLKGTGYKTSAIISSGVLSPVFGLNQGFDFYDGNFSENTDKAQTDAANATDRAIEWMDGRKKDDHIFMFVHYYDPHPPFEAPSRFQFEHSYDAEVAFVDEQIGVLLEHLKKKNRYRDALIIVTADHGESLKEHNVLGHTLVLFEQTLHIPLLIRFPGAKNKGKKIETLTRSVDLMPTILSILDIPFEATIDGVDLMSAFSEGNNLTGLISYAETFYSPIKQLHQKSLISNNWKLISFYHLPPGAEAGKLARVPIVQKWLEESVNIRLIENYTHLMEAIPRGRVLFDLSKDKKEMKDLYFDRTDIASDLEKQLDEVTSPLPGRTYAPPDYVMEQLRKLGYIR